MKLGKAGYALDCLEKVFNYFNSLCVISPASHAKFSPDVTQATVSWIIIKLVIIIQELPIHINMFSDGLAIKFLSKS